VIQKLDLNPDGARLREHLHRALTPLLERERRRQLLQAWTMLGAAAAFVAVGLRLLEEHRGWQVGGFWWVLLVGTVGAAVAVWYWVRQRPLEARLAARLIEEANPDLRALLLTAVSQAPREPGGRFGYMQEELIREALRRSGPTWLQAVSSSRLRWTGAAAAVGGAVVLYCAVTALLPDLPSLFEDEYGARVSPGHTEAERGTNVLVMARFDKKLPPGATLVVRRPGKLPARVDMRRTLDDPVYGALTPALEGGRVEYFVEYGGSRSPRFRIDVFEIPEVDHIDATIEYPRQPSLSAKEVKDVRHLGVSMGARITLDVHLHVRARDVSLIGDGNPIRLATRSGKDGKVFWGVLTPDRTRRYQVLVRDERGRANKAPPRLVVEVNPNQPPLISLSFPGKDLRVSPLEEVALEAGVKDDVGVLAYGITYRVAGQKEKEVRLGGVSDNKQAAPAVVARASIALEDLKAQPHQLLAYHFWAEDLDAAGKRRRAGSDLYFAEIRPFEERFREAPSDGQSQAGGGADDSPTGQLVRLQKDVMNANWRLERDARGGRPSQEMKEDVETVVKGQTGVKANAEHMRQEVRSPRGQAALGEAIGAMDEALALLDRVSGSDPVGALVGSLEAEQRAYAALLRLAESERMVGRRRGGGGGGGGSDQMAELSNLELKQKDSRYETRSEAASEQQKAGPGGDRELLRRLQELAARQKALTERLREEQAALKPENQRDEEERRRLKRLREEQQQLMSELDELANRQNQPQAGDQSTADAQLEQSRREAQAASEALARGEVGQAVGASTRATRELERARADLEKKMATGFEQQMRELRDQARKVDEEQRRIGDNLARNSGGVQPNPTEIRKLAASADKQKGETAKLLEKVQALSTESEPSAPLLSRKLYEGLRKAKLADVENALDITGQLLQRNLPEEARQVEQHARQAVGELRANVEDAAKGLLGDEAQALRQAKAELDRLVAQAARERGEDPDQPGGAAQGQPGNQQQPGGQQPGQQRGGQQQQQGRAGGRGEQRGGGEGTFAQGDPSQGDPSSAGGGGSGPNGGFEGPITGEGFRSFTEGLRDLEDLLGDARMRNRAAQVRDRARALRADFKREGKRPTHNLFQDQVLTPLNELRDTVAEELNRLERDDKLAPIDRDPVPGPYTDLVRRYWKRLSEGK
jgi:hypothetical protein